MLERLQRSHYRKWKERSTPAKRSGWGIPVTLGLSSIAVAFLIAFIAATAQTPWTVSDIGTVTPIVVGQEITGTIDSRYELDAFSFEVVQGERYVIQTGAPSTATPLEDSYLRLWYSDGEIILAWNNDYDSSLHARIEWTAEATGTFYVTVENGDTFSTGDYTLLIQCVSR